MLAAGATDVTAADVYVGKHGDCLLYFTLSLSSSADRTLAVAGDDNGSLNLYKFPVTQPDAPSRESRWHVYAVTSAAFSR